jgi:hypothetical protein
MLVIIRLLSATVQRARIAIGAHTKRRGYGPGAEWVWCMDAIDAKDTHRCQAQTLAPMADVGIYEHAECWTKPTFEVVNGAQAEQWSVRI